MARFVGYVDSSIALAHRASRCKKAWAAHNQICHQVILEQLPQNAKQILVIGSGLLLEIPFEELLKDSSVQLTLVDMVHPISVRKKTKKYGDRIRLLELDVTGAAHLLQGQAGAAKIEALDFSPQTPVLNTNYDFVISANIISQLPLDPYGRLCKNKLPWANDTFFIRLSEHMGRQHIAWLRTLGAKVLLISDVKRSYFDRRGQETEQVESAYVTRDGKLIKSWDWLISPLGESSKDYSFTMQVEARIL